MMSSHVALYRYLHSKGKIPQIPTQCNGTEAPLVQLEQAGLLTELEGLKFLSDIFHLKIVSMDKKHQPKSVASWDSLDFSFLWANRLCPIRETKTTLVMACCNPFDSIARKSLTFKTGKHIEIVLSTEHDILTSLKNSLEKDEQTEQVQLRKNKVLVIDDDPDIQDIVGLQLYHEDYEVERASNGLEGLTKVYETNPDVVLLDLKMPMCSGEKFLEKLKSDQSKSKLPVIVYTAIDTEENEVELLQKGATDFVSKTAPKNVLTSRIKVALS